MLRWFGSRWREVVEIHEPERLLNQWLSIQSNMGEDPVAIDELDENETDSQHLRDWCEVRDALIEHSYRPLWPYPSEETMQEGSVQTPAE
jgi:hypothetical protein